LTKQRVTIHDHWRKRVADMNTGSNPERVGLMRVCALSVSRSHSGARSPIRFLSMRPRATGAQLGRAVCGAATDVVPALVPVHHQYAAQWVTVRYARLSRQVLMSSYFIALGRRR
jgi:hypothetical protein